MGDRVRIGELLTGVGTIGLAIALGLLHWFQPAFGVSDQAGAAGLPPYPTDLKVLDAGELGWFAFLVLIAAVVAGIVYLLRVLTGRGPERAMLQAPVAYVFSGFAFLVLVWRLLLFQPGPSPDSISGNVLLSQAQIDAAHVDVSLTTGAYLGLLFSFLMVIGTWFSMYDERTGSAAAKRRTAELLADVPVRRVPHVDAPAEPEATVVADDAVPTDPSSPSSPASGGPA